MSVSDKVNKFINAASQLTTPQLERPERPRSPRCMNVEDKENETSVNVTEKIDHFLTTAERVKSQPRYEGPAPKIQRPEFKDLDENIKSDECLLSVSDKVNKFIKTAEKLGDKKPLELKRNNVIKEKIVVKEKSPDRKPSRGFEDVITECVQIESEDQMYTRKSTSPEKHGRKTPGKVFYM